MHIAGAKRVKEKTVQVPETEHGNGMDRFQVPRQKTLNPRIGQSVLNILKDLDWWNNQWRVRLTLLYTPWVKKLKIY